MREVTTMRIALRLGRRLRAEAMLDQRKIHGGKSGRGLRGGMTARAQYLALALKRIRREDGCHGPFGSVIVPARKKRVSTRRPIVNAPNPFEGLKRKHRLRLRHG